MFSFLEKERSMGVNIKNSFSRCLMMDEDHKPLEDQKPSHKCTFAECQPLAAAAYRDAHKEWLYGKLSLHQVWLLLLLKELVANRYRAQGSAKFKCYQEIPK